MRSDAAIQRDIKGTGGGHSIKKAFGKADVVISLNGRDGGKRFLIVETQDDYSMLADGKGRRIEKPKRKKNKHIKLEGTAGDRIAEKLKSGEKITNNEIRRALAQYAADHGEYSPGEKPLLEKEGGGM